MDAKKIVVFLIVLSLSSTRVALAQYYIDVSEYNRWLCNNVKGAEQACYAQPCQGNFQTREACEAALAQAKARLSYDARFQRMVYCKQIGDYSETKPSRPYLQERSNQVEQEVEEIRQEAFKQEDLRRNYIKEFQKENIRNEILELSTQIKITPPPMSQSDKERYKKALKDAWCIAYNSVQSAKLALSGNISVSGELETDLERLRSQAGEGFDKLSKCPHGIEPQFKIPEIKMAIEKDEQYKLLTDIQSTIQKLLPEIEKNIFKKKELKAKKEKIQEDLRTVEEQINQTKDKQTKEKLTKQKDDLLAQALATEKEAEEQEKISKELEMKVKNAEEKLNQFIIK